MTKYNKTPLSIAEQVQCLKKRNLIIIDDDHAVLHLSNIGYYRLSAYWLPYEQSANTGSNSRNHQFKANTTFNSVLDLYIFDRQLRLLIIEAIERIEVAVRAQWANSLSLLTKDPHAHLERSHFKDAWAHHKNISKIIHDTESSKETFVEHYRKTYNDPFLLPVLASVETMTLGELSRWYETTKNNRIKQPVAKALGMPTVEIMESVLHSLTLIRNICAHHARLWNRKMTMQLPNIKRLKSDIQTEDIIDKEGVIQRQPRREIYNYLIVLITMMKAINPTTSWTRRLMVHINKATPDQQIAMGFPSDWQNKPILQ